MSQKNGKKKNNPKKEIVQESVSTFSDLKIVFNKKTKQGKEKSVSSYSNIENALRRKKRARK